MEFERANRARHGINMVPLINIVFLLLIFFMLSTTLVAPDKIPIEAPESESSDEQKDAGLTITISDKGKLYLEEKMTTLEEISNNFNESIKTGKNLNVLIRADANSKSESVISVLQEARISGIKNVALATQTSVEK